jgi:hypothetical protein
MKKPGEYLFHIVRHYQVEDFLRLGWMPHNSLSGCTHGYWSVLVEWRCSCVPVIPLKP